MLPLHAIPSKGKRVRGQRLKGPGKTEAQIAAADDARDPAEMCIRDRLEVLEDRVGPPRFKLIVDDCDTLSTSLARNPRASTMALKRRPRSA